MKDLYKWFLGDWGWLSATLLVIFVILLCSFMTAVDQFRTWSQELEDPTERGLSYIAFAIVVHGILVGGNSYINDRQKK